MSVEEHDGIECKPEPEPIENVEHVENNLPTPFISEPVVQILNDLLVIISSKSPNNYLIENIQQINCFYPNTKICIVDSDSDNLENYNNAHKIFSNVDIHLIKNKNYEYGAWKFGYNLHPHYKKYICIQDSVRINERIDIDIVDDNNVFTIFDTSGFIYFSCPDDAKQKVKDLFLKDCNLNYLSKIDEPFNIATHCTFICNNNVMKKIFETLTVPPTNKDGSQIYERLFGLYFILKNIKTHNLGYKVIKRNGCRI